MKRVKLWLTDALMTVVTLLIAFGASLLVKYIYNSPNLIPMIFVMSVFLVAVRTQGYFWGVTASLLSVLAVNYAFTFPYYAFDLITPENFFSALIMLIVAVATGALTTKTKTQEKIKAEIEKERMRANLLRAISHDLRTPLTSIYGASSTVLENYDSLSREQHIKLLGEVRDDAQWLIRMMENLLSVTRIDGEKARIAKQPAALEELIDDVLVKFRKHYPAVRTEVRIPEEFISVPMDVMLIQQVLINLMENAAIHAKGMTLLELIVELEKDRIWFLVRDNGCGIPEERRRQIFSGYLTDHNLPSDSSRHNMGIGLSVCATIIKAHGGEILAKNNPEGGTTMAFWLNMED